MKDQGTPVLPASSRKPLPGAQRILPVVSPPPALSDLADHQLAALAREGDEAAQTEIHRRYRPTVHSLILHMVHQRELAEDLTQETFDKVFRRLHTARPDRKFSAWVYRIANNTALSHFRIKQVQTVPLEDRSDSSSPRKGRRRALAAPTPSDPTPLSPDTRKALQQAVKRLRGKYRRCIQLRFLEERSYDDIAQLLGLPVGTVATYLHRARQELKTVLGDA